MRRFEFSEGSSNKFWEIELSGSSFTVTWGKIGTTGQTQTKDFPTEAKAQSEHDKLVSEKVKKGYAEVGGATAAASTAGSVANATSKAASPTTAKTPTQKAAAPAAAPTAPAPAPAAVVAPPAAPPAPATPTLVVETGEITWDKAARDDVHPSRAFLPLVAPKVNRGQGEQRLIDAWAKQVKESKKLFIGGTSDTHAWFEAARRRIPNPSLKLSTWTAPQDPDVEAALYHLLTPYQQAQTEALDDLVDQWVDQAGAAFAIQALARTNDLWWEGDWNSPKTLVLGPTTSSSYNYYVFNKDFLAPAMRLREHLAVAPEESYSAALAKATELFGVDNYKVLVAYLFPDQDFAAQLPATDGALIFSGRDPKQAVELTKLGSYGLGFRTRQSWRDDAAPWQVCFTLLANLGVAATPALERILGFTNDKEWVKAAADTCAYIPTESAMKALFSRLEIKEVLAAASTATQRFPRRALAALAAVGGGRGRSSGPATVLLSQALRKDDGTLATLAQSLPASQAAWIAALITRIGPVADAGPGELHRILVEPPWLSKKKTVVTKTIEGMARLPYSPSIQWTPGQKEEWTDSYRTPADPKKQKEIANTLEQLGFDKGLAVLALREDPAALKLWEEEKKKKKLSGKWEGYITALPESLALRIWNEVPPTAFYGSAEKSAAAAFGLAALPGLLERIGRNAEQLELLMGFDHPDIGVLAGETLSYRKKGRGHADRWLRTHPQAAVVGLLPIALGRPGKARDAAGNALRLIANTHGNAAILHAMSAQYGRADVTEALEAVLATDPLDQVPNKIGKMPDFWDAGAFTRPRLRSNGLGLPLAAVDALGTMLSFSQLDNIYGGIAIVKELCTEESLGDFSYDLFNAWLFAGANSKDGWAFRQLGMIGNDDAARKLVPLIRLWPGESQHQRAVTGLDVLAAIGTDVALMGLNGIAQKVKFKGLQEAAREKIQMIAEARGLSPEELADRLVPDFNLDEQGTMILDFGPRQFRVGFDEQLRPNVRDSDGKLLTDLPKPNSKDDAEKSKEATDTWKTLKKDVKNIATQQVLRLELSMCSQRRWSEEVFRLFLAGHPLLGHLVRRLIWGAYDENGKLLHLFRVAEDGSYADGEDSPFDLSPDHKVGVVHVLELNEGQAAQFGQILADYQIIQPFRQLGRDSFQLTEEEKQSTSIDRLKNIKIPTGKILGLVNKGWRRGPAQDAGLVWWFERPIPLEGHEIHMHLDPGIATGMVDEFPEQTISLSIVREGDSSWRHTGTRNFGELDAVTASELLRELESLRG